MQADLFFFHVLKLIWEFVKGARQPALRNKILRMAVKQEELSWAEVGGTENSHPTHLFPSIAPETTSAEQRSVWRLHASPPYTTFAVTIC